MHDSVAQVMACITLLYPQSSLASMDDLFTYLVLDQQGKATGTKKKFG
jgi:hypothetical protein